jgi:predicted nucleotide-binding protein
MAKTRRDATPAPHQPTIPPELALRKLQKLLEQLPEIRSKGRGSEASTWRGNLKLALAEFYGEQSLYFREFDRIRFGPWSVYPGQPEHEFNKAFNSGLDQAKGFLESRVADLQERIPNEHPASRGASPNQGADSRKVFVVHGHDHGTKETVARFLEQLELEPIILHEQPDQGNTIIEKFEAHSEDVGCAVILLTADDIAASKKEPEKKDERARQNVILELGFFVGKLGRKHTFALVEKGVALPSDIHGLVYIPLDNEDWRMRLVKEFKAAGLEVDANRAF